MAVPIRRVLLAKPRGYCAGVDRAVQTVEMALERYGAPVYVRKQIVHNKHVVASLEKRGAVFVEETADVPEAAVVVFSAHGVAPQVRADAKARSLHTIDATCPLVTKVHSEARRFAAQGSTSCSSAMRATRRSSARPARRRRRSSWWTGQRTAPGCTCATRQGRLAVADHSVGR
jgi:Penicillin tolerance protein